MMRMYVFLTWQNWQVESSEISGHSVLGQFGIWFISVYVFYFWSSDLQLTLSSVWCEANLVWGPFCDVAYWIASVLILFFKLMLV